jgi:hypothetical protein
VPAVFTEEGQPVKKWVGGLRARLLLATVVVFVAAAGAAYATGGSDGGAVYTACKLNATGAIGFSRYSPYGFNGRFYFARMSFNW